MSSSSGLSTWKRWLPNTANAKRKHGSFRRERRTLGLLKPSKPGRRRVASPSARERVSYRPQQQPFGQRPGGCPVFHSTLPLGFLFLSFFLAAHSLPGGSLPGFRQALLVSTEILFLRRPCEYRVFRKKVGRSSGFYCTRYWSFKKKPKSTFSQQPR